MNGFRFIEADFSFSPASYSAPSSTDIAGSSAYWITKRIFDTLLCTLLLPILLISAALLFIANPIWNPGPLIYKQKRMGKNCSPFVVYKFRSMRMVSKSKRGVNDPIEHDRITRAGKFLRASRVDELPQIVNVLLGQMSLLGPRPDFYDHAQEFCEIVPNYRSRYSVRPGISGLAQVRLGYVVGTKGTRAKTAVDLEYLKNAGFRQDIILVFETMRCVVLRTGS